jgi:ankyrin repeat protein
MRIMIRLYYVMKLYRCILIIVMLLLVFSQAHSQENDSSDLAGMGIHDQLFIAADKGDTLSALKLLSQGADINATNYEGVTPLMFAAQSGHANMVTMLMQHGADAGIKPFNGYTALIAAIRNSQPEAAENLLRNGAAINQADNNKVTPLMHAIAVDSFYIPDMLLYYGAAIDLKNSQGTDALMIASQLGRYEIAIKLLAAGADINAIDLVGNTPLHYATFAGQTAIMELLIVNGASLEVTNSSGYTPLSIAAAADNFSAARMLIAYGADVNSRVNGSLNPLTLAIRNKNDSLVNMLVNHDAHATRGPNFNKFTVGTRYTFNGKDSQLGFSFGITDSRYNLMAGLGYGFRPEAIQVLEEQDPNLYYQYWERRHFISFSLDKAFFLRRGNSAFITSAFAGFSEVLTFGSYKGSNEHPDVRLLINPRIGCLVEYYFIRVKLGFELLNLHLEDIDKSWFNVSLEFLLNRKRGSLKMPSSQWLYH